MKVILAHPGQQHSFKVANALKQEGHLLKFITSIYDAPNSFLMRILRVFLRDADKNKASHRRDPFLDDSVITYYTLFSLLVIALSRIHFTRSLSYRLDRRIADWFGLKVAKYAIKNKADAVLCFSMNETKCFEYLSIHCPSIIRIVDCANSPVKYMKHIYDHDQYHECLKLEVPSFWDNNVLLKQQSGIDLTNFFLAPSGFVKQGLIYCGVPQDRIAVLHYGSNFLPELKRYNPVKCNGHIRLIYVGQVTYRKGLPYLLETFSQLDNSNVSLDIVGGWNPNSDIYEKYRNHPRITFHGHVSRDQVKELLIQSDLFVFPSLTEGFSLSVLEAMSMGLPVIVSMNSGTNDLIEDGVNGFTFKYNDTVRLGALIRRFVDAPDLLVTMGYHAFQTAQKYTWNYYAHGLSNICKALQSSKTTDISRVALTD